MSKFNFKHFAKNVELETDNVSLKADNTNLLAKVKELESKLAEADKTASVLPLASEEWKAEQTKLQTENAAKIETLSAAHKVELDNLKAELEATKGSLNKEVVAQLAGVGIQAGTIKEETKPAAEGFDTLEKELAVASPKERAELFNKNKDNILKHLGITAEQWNATINRK